MKPVMSFELPCTIKKDDEIGMFIAICPQFDLASQGVSKKEAKKNLAQALHLFILSCFERGTLEAVFAECGITPFGLDMASNEIEFESITVPIPLIFIKPELNSCPV